MNFSQLPSVTCYFPLRKLYHNEHFKYSIDEMIWSTYLILFFYEWLNSQAADLQHFLLRQTNKVPVNNYVKTRIAENIDKEFLTDTENFNSEKHMPEIHALIQISMLLTDFGILSLFDQISHLSLG